MATGSSSTLIQFNVRLTLPKKSHCTVLVVGDIAEMFNVDFNNRNNMMRQRNLQRDLQGCLKAYQTQHAVHSQMQEDEQKDEYDEDDSDSSDDEEELGTVSKDHWLQIKYFEEAHLLLYADPEGFNVRDLWATKDPIEVKSRRAGQSFRFAYVVWDLDARKIWSMEKLTEPRSFLIPPYKSQTLYRINSGLYGDRADESVDVVNPYPPIPSNPYSDDEDEFVFAGIPQVESRRAPLPEVPNKYQPAGEDEEENDDF